MNDTIKIILVVVLIAALVIIAPLLTIWALNTLFPVLAIPYTFWTWAAIVLLSGFAKSNVTVKK